MSITTNSTDAQLVLDNVYGNIQTLQNSVQASLNDIKSVISVPYLSWFDFSGTTPPTLPAIPKLDITQFPVLTMDDLPQLQRATLGIADTSQIDTTLLDNLKSVVQGIIDSGGQNISPTVQDAVFNMGYERNLQILRDAIDITGARTGSRGYRYPNSMMKAQQDEILLNYMWQREDTNREIIRTMADIAQKNLDMAITAGVSINKAIAEIAIQNLTYLLEAQKLVYEKFRIEQEANLSLFKGQLEAIVAQFDALAKSQQLQIQAETAVADLGVKASELELRKWMETSQIIVEKGKAQIQQMGEANKIKIEAIKDLASTVIGLLQVMNVQGVSVVTKRT
jgi:hypothetical protein